MKNITEQNGSNANPVEMQFEVVKNEVGKFRGAVGFRARLQALFFLCIAVGMLLLTQATSWAQSNFPDPTAITTAVQTPFNNALTWIIGALSVLTILGWIIHVIRRKR